MKTNKLVQKGLDTGEMDEWQKNRSSQSYRSGSFNKYENCVLMVFCGLNNNTFKLFLKEHMVMHGYKNLTISFVSH